ncbi:MAG: AAA family ATPase [Candidatus Yonathbacteria bacterium]|nr:AAA family ATPase [Candidatus Yonathbacteria bacterium]
MKQSEALQILKMGHNAFVTGAAGSGKTHLLNEYIRYLREHNVSIGITASTGIAATHMGGVTIHAWSGLGIRDTLSPHDISSMEEKSYLWKRFENTHILIIDEISMLHHFRLDLINKIAQSFKKNDKPFGGMQVILCGDFFQLPPISRQGEAPAKFAYHSDSWKDLELKICYLEEQHRQSDGVYLDILNAIRDNTVSSETTHILATRLHQDPETVSTPTKLSTHNISVDTENMRELEKLPGEMFEYKMKGKGRENLVTILKKGCLAPETLVLKVGARVMMVKNNFEEKYANGTLGVVTNCDNYNITVKLADKRTIIVKQTSWKIEEDGKVKAEIIQYPIRLAWAITVHKSQGMSLDSAEVDLTQAFEKVMGYVALSRVRTLGGLTLRGINKKALEVDSEVLDFDKKFRKHSKRHTEEFLKKLPEEIAREHKKFIERVAPPGTKKIKKLSTTEETRRLIESGKTLAEIVSARGLKLGTILDHLEKLKKEDPKINLSPLEKSMTKTRLQKITHALIKGGMQGGVYFLTPAKNLLSDDVSFDDIRIARLLLK